MTLLEEMQRYKKVDVLSLSLEDFEMKTYFKSMNIESSRIFFRHRSQTMTSCRTHYRSDERNISEVFNCFSCQSQGKSSIDQLSHWVSSDCYSHLKTEELSGSSDEALCEFYRKVIQFRRENGDIQ